MARHIIYLPGAGQVLTADPATVRVTEGTNVAFVEAEFLRSVTRKIFFDGMTVPDDLDTTANITIRAKFRQVTAGTGDLRIDVAYRELSAATNRDGAALTSIGAQTVAVVGTLGAEQAVDFTVAAAGLTAGRELLFYVQRQGAHAADTFVGEIALVFLSIIFPIASSTGTNNLTFTINLDAAAASNEDPALRLLGGDGVAPANDDIVRTTLIQDSSAEDLSLYTERNRNAGGFAEVGTVLHIGQKGQVANLIQALRFAGGDGGGALVARIVYDTGDLFVENTSATGDVILKLGDAAGGAEFQLQDSGGNPIFLVSSDHDVAIDIKDNSATAFAIGEGANAYIQVDTQNGSEVILLGNGTTDPKITQVGIGDVTFFGNLIADGGEQLPDDTLIEFGDDDDATLYYDTGNARLDLVGSVRAVGGVVPGTHIRVRSGTGSAASGGGDNAGDGGDVSIVGGRGGAADTADLAGIGGTNTISGGTGGAGDAAVLGGFGGPVVLEGGTGGAGTAGALSGAGGPVTIRGGAAGATGGAGRGLGNDVAIWGGDGSTVGSVLLGTQDTVDIAMGNAIDNTTITQAGSGQVTFTGNVDATAGLDVTVADLTVSGVDVVIDVASDGIMHTGSVQTSQATNNNTAVTANGTSGVIEMFGVIAAGASHSFTVNNTSIGEGSVLLVSVEANTTANIAPSVSFHTIVPTTSFDIAITNQDGANATLALPKIHFLIINHG